MYWAKKQGENMYVQDLLGSMKRKELVIDAYDEDGNFVNSDYVLGIVVNEIELLMGLRKRECVFDYAWNQHPIYSDRHVIVINYKFLD